MADQEHIDQEVVVALEKDDDTGAEANHIVRVLILSVSVNAAELVLAADTPLFLRAMRDAARCIWDSVEEVQGPSP